jgi:hypothetical protein
LFSEHLVNDGQASRCASIRVKTRILIAIIFLCLPVTILVIAVVHHKQASAVVWFDAMRTDQDAALVGLQHLGVYALPTLRDRLRSPAPTERCRAALALGKLGPVANDTVSDLIQVMDDDNPSVRCEVMLALSRLKITNQEVASKLMSKIPDAKEGAYAATLLNSIIKERKSESLLPIPCEGYEYGSACLTSAIPAMRLNGAIHLAAVSATNQMAAVALQGLLHDENGWVRQEVSVLVTNSNALGDFKLLSE